MGLQLVILLLALFAFQATIACQDGHDHDQVKRTRRDGSNAITPPTRPLEWGTLNIIHTTDTHGWLLGHQKGSFPEPNYSGDLGDFASFVDRMKKKANDEKVDLLLVDSGDIHDGSGLVDGFPSGGVEGHDALQIFKLLPYDVLAIGNHELYQYSVALDTHRNFVPKFNGRYLTSNVNITYTDSSGKIVNKPIGARYLKFKTEQKGYRVTALGVLFNFAASANGTIVQKVENMVKGAWFAEAIKDEPDVFLLAGHMPVQKDRWPVVFNAIRAVHPQVPILILGGHAHVRDCVQLDPRSMSLASGRYMETIGWMSVNLDETNSTKPLAFSRRYLDANPITYKFHAGLKGRFDTKLSAMIKAGLRKIAKCFHISLVFGYAPKDLGLGTVPYPSNDSILSTFIEDAVPTALSSSPSPRHGIPAFFVASSGNQRFSIFQGPFTRDDALKASPFENLFRFVPGVRLGVAKKALDLLNKPTVAKREGEEDLLDGEAYGRGDVERLYWEWVEKMAKIAELEKRTEETLTLGYVTKDACPGPGDDILHTPIPAFPFPDFIGSRAPAGLTDDAPVDLVFVDFIEPQVLSAINALQSGMVFAASDVGNYSSVSTKDVWGLYAAKAWQKDSASSHRSIR